MIKILEKGRNITTTDHTNIFNIFMIQPEFMLAGFLFFKNIQCHTFSTIFYSSTSDGSGNSAAFSDQHAGTGTSWCRP